MYKRILVATDGSELSQKAVTHAIELAVVCKAEMVVIKVNPLYPQSYFEGSISLNQADVERIEAQWLAESQAAIDAASAQATAAGVPVTGQVLRADVISDAIISAAKAKEADLIVMASHGRKGISRLLLGSETQQVLTHSTVPVLVLR